MIKDKTLFVAWHDHKDNSRVWGTVGVLDIVNKTASAGQYRFRYTIGADRLTGFKPFTGMRNLREVYNSTNLFPLFASRLLVKSRPEYRDYLAWSGFDANNPPSPLELLAVTEGRRVTDSVELFPQMQPDENGNYANNFFIHKIQDQSEPAKSRVMKLCKDEQLHLVLDGDPSAVTLCTQDGLCMGYLPRYLSHDVRILMTKCPCLPTVTVVRLNTDAPTSQRVLCRLETCWPGNLTPYSSEEFMPMHE